MLEPKFRAASLADLRSHRFCCFGTPVEEVEAHIDGFLVALRMVPDRRGLERYGSAALLRSVAVANSHRGKKVARRLVAQLIERGRDEGIESLLLLTMTKAGYFEHFGFKTIGRAEVPAAVQGSVQFQGVCHASATVMRLDILDKGSTLEACVPRAEGIHNQPE
jgi:amino-acid N-acetyltransferase